MVLQHNPNYSFSSISELEARLPSESKRLSPLSDGAVSTKDDSPELGVMELSGRDTGLGARVLVLVPTFSCFFS